MVVSPVAQPVVVALAPSEHGTRPSQGHAKLRSTLNFEHSQPGKRVYLERDFTSIRATPAQLAVVTITEGPNVVVISNTQSLSIAAP